MAGELDPSCPTDADRQPGHGALRRGRRGADPGRIYLITTCTHERERLFADWRAGRLVVAEMKRLEEAGEAISLAWVVMPDHWHWLMQLPREANNSGSSLPALMKRVKGRSARAVNVLLGRSDPVWQRGYHDHALRREEDLAVIARYIVANPLRAGLAREIGEYPLWDTAWEVGDLV